MAVFRFFTPAADIEAIVEGTETAELVALTPSKIVLSADSELFVHIMGDFDYSSQSRFLASRITAIEFTRDLDRREPLLTVTQIDAPLGTLAADPARIFSGNDLFIGSPGDDDLTFFDAPAFGRGNDTLRGGAGDDALHGGLGNDKLFGEAGSDTLYLGPGKDQATGGAGGDRFVLLANSRGGKIMDFDVRAGDRLELRAAELFADSEAVLADPDGFLRLVRTKTGASLQLDTDGGGDRFATWVTIKGELGASDLDSLIAAGTLAIV